SAETNEVSFFLKGGLKNFIGRHHDAEIDDLVVVTAEDDAHDIFADVMHVTFDGGHDDPALRLVVTCGALLGFHKREQISHRLFHHAGALDHLRQKHFAGTKQIADDIHADHERPFDD